MAFSNSTNLSQKIFCFLEGEWQLDRSINDESKMKGVASFSPLSKDSLTFFYREEGKHTLKTGDTFSFFKEYIYILRKFYIDVYFARNKERGDLFHKLMFSESSGECLGTGEHHCGKDTYTATYQFFNSDRFTLQYNICGPKKNLKIQTLFQRQSPLTHLSSDESS